MAPIPDSVVARLKRQVSLQRLVEAAGVEIAEQRRGEWVGVCPFHAGESESAGLVVSGKSNSWRCAGGCGGSVVDWVMRADGVSFRHAVELLRDGHTPSRLDRPPPALSSVPKLETVAFSPELSDGCASPEPSAVSPSNFVRWPPSVAPTRPRQWRCSTRRCAS